MYVSNGSEATKFNVCFRADSECKSGAVLVQPAPIEILSNEDLWKYNPLIRYIFKGIFILDLYNHKSAERVFEKTSRLALLAFKRYVFNNSLRAFSNSIFCCGLSLLKFKINSAISSSLEKK